MKIKYYYFNKDIFKVNFNFDKSIGKHNSYKIKFVNLIAKTIVA